jgi:hypothetical protein
MILKFILLGSMCYTIETKVICRDFIQNPILSDSQCRSAAYSIGMTVKDRIEKKEGSMEHYEVHCIAIDPEGYNIDHSFKISYNIL